MWHLNLKEDFELPIQHFKMFYCQCVSANVFNQRLNSTVPLEFQLLISLRILGRGYVADDLNEFCEEGGGR